MVEVGFDSWILVQYINKKILAKLGLNIELCYKSLWKHALNIATWVVPIVGEKERGEIDKKKLHSAQSSV